MTDDRNEQDQPLRGLKVLDLGRYYQAPYAAFLMAMAGADVVKVEPVQGEPLRRPLAAGAKASYAQALLNSNKRAITLNLKHPRGCELLARLAARVDVLIENFAPGVMDRLGIGYSTLQAQNPRLVYASGTGFGLTGPDRDHLALDHVIQAYSGVTAVTGPSDGPPVKAGATIADFLGGTHLYGGIMTALYERERTGRGRLVEVALQEALYPSLTSNLATLHYKGREAVRTGNRHGVIAPYNLYKARDGWVAILCTTDDHWQRLLRAMNRPELGQDPRFATNKARMTNLDDTDAEVERWTSTRTRQQVFEAASEHAVPAAPVRELDEVMQDAHMHERGALCWIDHPDLGRIVAMRSAIRYRGAALPAIAASAGLGQHNREIYGDWLNLDEAELADLRRDGVI
jgi:crotonobetainyl-CoA:carnitine CoA-transferase CaiB-like acyl-CoA transferase